MARDDSGDFGYRPLIEAMYASLLDLVDQGLVLAEEMHRMAIPTVGRTRAEFESPFGREGRFAGLSIEHLEVFNGEDRIWQDFRRLKTPARSARSGPPFRGLPCFRRSLRNWTEDTRDPRGEEFLQRLEAGTANRLAKAPEQMSIPLAKMVFVKCVN